MLHRTVLLASLLLGSMVACSAPQNADTEAQTSKGGLDQPRDDEAATDASDASDASAPSETSQKGKKDCSLEMIRDGETCLCPSYTPGRGEAEANFRTDKTLRGDFFGHGEALAMGLEGCGDSPGLALFDADGKYRAFSTFDIESCVVGPEENGVELLGCMDDRPVLSRGTEATIIHVLSFAQAGTTHNDRVVATYRRPGNSCPTGKVKIIKDVELSGSDDFVATYQRAIVELPDGVDYCDWAKSNSPEFHTRTKGLGTGAEDPIWYGVGTKRRSGSKSGVETSRKVGDFCSRDSIAQVVRSGVPGIGRCFDHAVWSRAVGYGSTKARWLIGLDGTVKDIGFSSDEITDVGVRHCLANVIRLFQFEQPNGGMCLINYPFVLGPEKK